MTSDRTWPSECPRVLIVAPRAHELSGGSTYVTNLANGLLDHGVDVHIVSLHPGTRPSDLPTTTIIEHEELHRRPVMRSEHGWRPWRAPLVLWKRWDRRQFLRRFRRIIDDATPNTLIIFTHVLPMQFLRQSGWRHGRGKDAPIVVGQHHSAFASLDDEPWLKQAIPQNFGDVDAFTALTPEDATDFASLLPGVPCHALPNPSATVVATSDRTSRTSTVVALARYSTEKQLDLMVRAFAAATAAADLRHWRLDLYGEGSEQATIQAAIDASGAADRIRLRGPVSEISPVLLTASLNLLSSRLEGFGMSVLEAAQHEVPSLAFGCSPGVTRLVGEMDGVVVQPPNDEVAYADALATLLRDPADLRRRGERAQQEAARLYSAEAVIAQWSTLVEELLSAR